MELRGARGPIKSVLVLGATIAILTGVLFWTHASAFAVRALGTGDVATIGSATPTACRLTVSPGHVTRIDLPSGDASASTRRALVYRPGVPDSATLPVIYMFHGYPGDPEDLLNDEMVSELDRAAADGSPVVVVAPDGSSTIRPDTEWADSGDAEVRLEHFVTATLIDAVEAGRHREAAHRAVIGFSMGGYGAANVGLRHPELFSQIAALAGYFHADDPDGMAAHDATWSLRNSPDAHTSLARGRRVFLREVDGETDPLIAGETTRFAALLRRDGATVDSSDRPGSHSTQWFIDQLPDVLRFLDDGWGACGVTRRAH